MLLQGLFSVLTALGNFAPALVGAFAGGSLGAYELGDVLLWSIAGCYAISGVLFGVAAVLDDKRTDTKLKQENTI